MIENSYKKFRLAISESSTKKACRFLSTIDDVDGDGFDSINLADQFESMQFNEAHFSSSL